jgi:amino acid adenylation domain-containing protein
VEPGEIEARLAAHPGVREAVVLALDDGAGGKRLVAYFVGEALESEALRAHLTAQLPEYMVPAAFVRLDAFPVTPNGKLDRRALPAPDADAFAVRDYEAPVGETEQALAEIWSELLGVERVGRGDHFFALGGHSLLAVRVVSRVRQALGVEAEIGDLFVRPVLADFARGLETAARAEAPAIVPVERSGPIPLSFAQQRLWFIEQMEGAGAAYHLDLRLRLKGELDREALVRALERIVARHEALRTRFPETDGVPAQRISAVEEGPFHLIEHDLEGRPEAPRELDRLMEEEAGAPFDLARGPLVRGRLVRMAADDHVLLVTMHHIVSDGWSLGIFTRELSALYGAFRGGRPDPLPPLPVQYADYAAWQRRRVEGEVLQRQADYWRQALSGAPELLELPTDHARPARQDFAGAWLEVELDEALTAALRALGQRHGATLHMTLLAGWAAVLARLSGQDEVVVGTPSANRGRSEIEDLIGFFVNTLALRVDLSGSPGVAELLGRVKERSLGAQHHQDIPFEQVVELVQPARSLAHSPLFQVMFAWQNAPGGSLELPGLAVGPPDPSGSGDSSSPAAAKFDLSLVLWEDGGRIAGNVIYATALFERETVERWLGYLRRVLEEMAADGSKPVGRLELLGDAERALLLEAWNRTERQYPRGVCIHDLFEAQVRERPGAVALAWGGAELTYAELSARANRLAHHLVGLGVGPEARVGVMLERGVDLIVSLLAVLKAGGCYVPLDPEYPAERLRLMLDDSRVRVLLSRSDLAGVVETGDLDVVHLDRSAEAIASESMEAPAGRATAENLAYIVYTSGSTGRPKGVMVGHRQVVQLVVETDYVQLRPGDRVAQASNAGFDALTFEAWGAFLNGATLVGVPQDVLLSPRALRQALREERITTIFLTTALVNQLSFEEPDIFAPVREVLFGGQAVDAESVRRLLKAGRPERLLHMYGPTETTTFCLYEEVEHVQEEALTVPLGRATGNQRIYLLDGVLGPVPLGVPGEAFVGGAGVSRGYLDRPALTAERFVPDPFAGEPGARMYRTGDRMRRRGEGKLEFVGRLDAQVKIRGFRVEPGEIETRLLEHAGVRDALVLVREDAPGDRRLVAYYLADEPAAVDALKSHLASRLPEYMVPAAYVWMEAYPLTPNGKVDRGALPAPEGDAYASREYEAPAGEAEEALAAIWAELLGVERVGRWDHFFEVGGHSLLAVRVVSRVRQALGVEAEIGDLFVRPVLADFARGLQTAARAEAAAIAPVERSGPLALSFAQQRLWFLEQLGNLGSTYHIPMRLRLRGGLDRGALVRSLDRIVARHEALRTSFPTVNGEPVQHVAPVEESGFRLVEHDLRASADAEAELGGWMEAEARAPFDLERGPLVRGRLIRLAADDHVLLITMHHIVGDGWSMGVLFGELSALYAAFRDGEPDPLPELPVQYADYAAWQRGWVEGELLERQASHWERALAGAPELLELPTDRARPRKQDFAGDSVDVELDEALTAALKALSQRHGATLFMTLLAGWATVLARLSGQDDVVVGTPSANRGQPEIEELIGFFVNTLALRVDLSGAPTVAELLRQVRARALEAQQNQDIPFEQVVERVQPARSLAHTPLFQVMFAWQNAAEGRLELPGLHLEAVPGPAHEPAKFDLTLTLSESGDRIVGGLSYASALFERETVERWAGYLRRVLEEMAADESRPVGRLALVPESERALVLEAWNRTAAEVPADLCIHELFEAQAERTPGAVAVVFEDAALTYDELNRSANRLAHHLRALGVGPDARVAICVERGPEMVAGLLAILKAGGAYVPLDPAYPAERLRTMLEDSAPAALVTQSSLAGTFAGLDVPAVELDAPAPAWAQGPETNPACAGLTPDRLAYVIYTSGSTGRPKGVMVEHRSLINHTAWQAAAFGIGARDTVLQRTSISFDASVWELWTPLATGARMLLLSSAAMKDPGAIGRVMAEGGVTVAQVVPTLLQAVLGARLAGAPLSCRTLFCGGEPLSAALVEEARAAGVGEVVNLYGPTEATIDSTWHPCPAGDGRAPAIGRPIANARIYVLDAHGEPAPVGVAGELYVGGAGVARGYLGRAGLTAERFVPDPFSAGTGARMYRTGDLGRWRADGTLEFLGRTDFQVKIRGFRIEPGEIEAALLEHEGVREAVVLAREDTPGDRRLVAYVVGGEAASAEALRAHLGATLPAYMVPAAYVRLERLPLTPNGKLDRRALPAPEGDAYAAREYEAPVGKVEQALAEIWAELLGAERVGRGDDFFMLGGHSILAVQMISRVRQAMEVELPLAAVFEKPELSALADRILDLRLARFDPETLARLARLVREPGAQTA